MITICTFSCPCTRQSDNMTDIATLFTEYHHLVRAFIYNNVRNWHIAEDLASEVYCRILAAIRNGGGPQTNEIAYLWRTVRNVLIDHWRKEKREKMVDIDGLWMEATPDDVENQVAASMELVRTERHMMNTMTEGQRVVIDLRTQGYAWHEIGEMMNSTENAAKALRIRALENLNTMVR